MNAELSRRMTEVRKDLYGEHGGPILADAVGVPARTWFNYESGVAVDGTVLLRFIDVTGACPRWLLTGEPPRFRLKENAPAG